MTGCLTEFSATVQNLKSLARARAADIPLRPLLYASGTAAAAAGVYYYIMKRGDGEKTADTTLTEDPVQTQLSAVDVSLLDPGLMSDVDGVRVTQTDSGVPQESLSEAGEKNQKVEVSSAPVHSERSNLEDRVRELEELLCEAHRECERKTKECEREQEAHNIMKLQYDEMKETSHNAASLKVSLAETERKYEQVMESNAQLKNENSDLVSKVNTLQDSLQDLGILLSETHTECAEAVRSYESELNLRKYVQSEYDKREENCSKKISTLRVTLAAADKQYEQAMESIAQLEKENSKLMSDVKTLQDSMLELDEELSVTRIRCNEITRECEGKTWELGMLQSDCNDMKETLLKECEKDPEVHRMLLSQNDELKKLLNQKEELLKVSLAEAERKCEQAMEHNAQLENENSNLMSQVNTLQGSVQQLEEEVSETHRKCEEIKREYEREAQCKEMRATLEQCNVLLKECAREREAHSVLKLQHSQVTLTHTEESLKVSLAEAERKYEQAKETNTRVENEKSVLVSKVNQLQDTVRGLTTLLAQTYKKCTKALSVCAIAKGVADFVESEATKRVTFLIQTKKSLEVALAEAEQKFERAKAEITQLENNKAEIESNIRTLLDMASDSAEQLCETRRRCDEVTRECVQKTRDLRKLESKWNLLNETVLKDYEAGCVAHGVLRVQYNELKEQHEELLKECEREREAHSVLKSQYDQMKETSMQSNAQLENEKSDLMYHVHKLGGRVQQLEELLYEADMICGAIKQECKREREAHSDLKVPYDEMKETQSHNKESLKVTVAEAEEKYGPAIESSAQLDNEKSDLMSQQFLLGGCHSLRS
ncbi:myosin heavy chain, striated muscle-like isoform X2 [Ictalurus furcatus]|uniref:myosin heavy chain, striated muscle-like isoform X2 n=1 Tax=Ictalurus furcatus TaxID=66913 RepID=UPI002350F2DB|nr:myosin heavy chain, striated muscle-like isoform X2 [Ictalurus furcatus]